ncbi:MAG TPA: TonB-dependent receptor, partial [Geminicoccaceae bacterium]|nr:TonB-dependent receptor [Geminicoccaceae bacterium]
RISPSPRSDVLLSLIYAERDERSEFVQPEARIGAAIEEEGYQSEAQYLFRAERLNLTAGLGAYDIDVDSLDVLDFSPRPCELPGGVCEFPASFSTEQRSGYVYANLNLPEPLIWTLGFSYDSFERDDLDRDEFNPKLGLQWRFAENARLRLAAVRTLKRTLAVNQTLEPTQVAGFNQLFDDFDGTIAELYGAGLDARLVDGLYGGVEVARRDLEVPTLGASGDLSRFEDWREEQYRAYLYWTPHTDWALSAELRYEEFERRNGSGLQPPIGLNTLSLPLTVRYFHPSGVFAGLGATYVYQDVDRIDDPRQPLNEGHDDFVVVDASIGYRLPDRRGIISVDARNLLDERFFFQDNNFRATDTRIAPYVPDASVLVRATLSF